LAIRITTFRISGILLYKVVQTYISLESTALPTGFVLVVLMFSYFQFSDQNFVLVNRHMRATRPAHLTYIDIDTAYSICCEALIMMLLIMQRNFTECKRSRRCFLMRYKGLESEKRF
jgi:hypothetical protein